jgi:hypothetical protein
MADPVRQLLYISDARFGLKDRDIESILASSRRNNGAGGITGMLLYSTGVFIQALEGEHNAVETLYNRIADDPRHANIAIISDQMVAERSFGDWAMGFVEASAEELGVGIGINGALDRDQVLALLSGADTGTAAVLRRFARNAT